MNYTLLQQQALKQSQKKVLELTDALIEQQKENNRLYRIISEYEFKIAELELKVKNGIKNL